MVDIVGKEDVQKSKRSELYEVQKTRCVEAVYFQLANLKELEEMRGTANYGDLCGACHVEAAFYFQKYNKK